MHWDMTSFSLHGAYEHPDEEYPAPCCGHPKDRREDLLQIQAGIAAATDGGIPVYHRAYSGGAAEISQVTGAMTALQKIAGTKKFLLVGDSKLISYDNVAAIGKAGCTFLAPASKTYVKAAELAACDLAKATEVAYVAGRDQHKKDTGQLGRWYVLDDDQPFAIRNSKRKSDPPIRLRRIFVHSTARAGAAATSRAKKLTRAKDDLGRLVSGLGGRFYPDEQKAEDRVKQISLARKVGPYLRYTISTAPAGGPGSASTGRAAGTPEATGPGPADTWQGTGSGGPGKPTLTWWFDQQAIHAEAATDGWYALLTNTGAEAETAAEVLLRYKAQEAVERRYGNLKGPLAVAPMFLNSNRRIAALITVISLALLVFCLIEREARRSLAPQTKVDGLYNRQPVRRVPGRGLPDHHAGRGVQRGEQIHGAVPLIVVAAPLRGARDHRQHRGGPLQRPDLRLLIHREHRRVRRRSEVEADDIADLVDQERVGGQLELLHQPGFEPEGPPDPVDRGRREPDLPSASPDPPIYQTTHSVP